LLRFAWLRFARRRFALLMSAEVQPEQLYTEGVLSNEFHRTVSRIIEMQSLEYMEAERRSVAEGIV